MSAEEKDRYEQARKGFIDLRKSVPDVMAAFAGLGAATYTDGVLDKKTKELICIAVAMAKECDDCVTWHANTAVKLGITREEIAEMAAVVMHMGGGPGAMYAIRALRAYDTFKADADG